MPAATLTVNPDSHMWEEFPLNDTSWDEMTEAAVSSAGFDEGPAEISESSPVPLPEDPLLEFYFDKESPVELLEGAVRLKEIVAGEPSPRNFFQLPIASLTGPSGVNAWRDCGCGVSLGLALGDMDVDEDFEASMWAAFEEVISTRLRRHIVADDVARSRHVNLGGRIVHYKNLLGMWTFELTDVSVNTVIQPRALKRRRFKCQGRQELSFACSGLRIAAVDDEAVRRFLHRQWRDDAKRSAVLDSIQVVDSKIYHTRLPLLEKRAQLRKLNQSTAAIFSSVQELVDREEHPLPADRRANARAALLVDQLARGRPVRLHESSQLTMVDKIVKEVLGTILKTAGFDQQSLASAADFINTIADAQGVTVDQLARMDSKSLDDLASQTLSDVDASEEDKKVQLAAMEALKDYGKRKAGAPSNSSEDQMMQLFRESNAQMVELKGKIEAMANEFGMLKKRRAALAAAEGESKNNINISLKYSGLAANDEGEKTEEENDALGVIKGEEDEIDKQVKDVEEEIVKEVPNPSHLKVPIVVIHQTTPDTKALMQEANREKHDPKSIMAKMKKQAEAVDPAKLLEYHQNQLSMVELLQQFHKDDAERVKSRIKKYRQLEEEFDIHPPKSEAEGDDKDEAAQSNEA